MKASQYPVSFDKGSIALTCCMDHIMECQDEVKPGSTIVCDHCGITLRLDKDGKGGYIWVGIE